MSRGGAGSRGALIVALITGGSAYLLVFSEWLFQVTKPSMFTVMGWPERIAILLTAVLLAASPAIFLAVLLTPLDRVIGRWREHAPLIALVVPALLLSATGFLLVENFTKTVLGFNIGDIGSPLRYLYAAGWILLTFKAYRVLARHLDGVSARLRKHPGRAGLALLLVLTASVVAAWPRYAPRSAATLAGAAKTRPNILILSSDGLNAVNLSIYGYARETTPFLRSRLEEFLISENHFSNSAYTAASIAALLTGKLPTTTGVFRAGDILRGVHVYEHLPGLLRQLGYYTIDVSARHYGDPYDMNLHHGFDVANDRSERAETLPLVRDLRRVFPSESYFLDLTLERVGERLLHAFGIRDMRSAFDVVGKEPAPWSGDDRRLRSLQAQLAAAPRPFFVNLHLLNTHPRRHRFFVTNRKFSAAESGVRRRRRLDVYDDAVLAFDEYAKKVITRLEASGELDRTLLIINTDHGHRRDASLRLPLLLRFPGAEHRGRIRENTQRIDIAPTILSYLGVSPPAWMVGESLIGAPLDPRRPVVVAGKRREEGVHWLALVQCQRSFRFDLLQGTAARSTVIGHTEPCPEETLLTEREARDYLVKRLATGSGPADRLARRLLEPVAGAGAGPSA